MLTTIAMLFSYNQSSHYECSLCAMYMFNLQKHFFHSLFANSNSSCACDFRIYGKLYLGIRNGHKFQFSSYDINMWVNMLEWAPRLRSVQMKIDFDSISIIIVNNALNFQWQKRENGNWTWSRGMRAFRVLWGNLDSNLSLNFVDD